MSDSKQYDKPISDEDFNKGVNRLIEKLNSFYFGGLFFKIFYDLFQYSHLN